MKSGTWGRRIFILLLSCRARSKRAKSQSTDGIVRLSGRCFIEGRRLLGCRRGQLVDTDTTSEKMHLRNNSPKITLPLFTLGSGADNLITSVEHVARQSNLVKGLRNVDQLPILDDSIRQRRSANNQGFRKSRESRGDS